MKIIKLVTLTTFIFLLITSCEKEVTQTTTSKNDIESKIDSVLALMELVEKVGQMNQLNAGFDVTGPDNWGDSDKEKIQMLKDGKIGSFLNCISAKATREMQRIAVEETRLGIPLVFGFDVIHGYRTAFPIPLAEAASWDIEAIERSAKIAAIEASAAGVHWTFAPMVDITWDPRWGRIIEGAGEDPYYGSKVAAARVRGFQGEDLSANNTIAACAKHFAGYGFAQGGRDYNTTDFSTQTLNNIVLPPFKAAKDAGVATFMNAFNEIGGVPATASTKLQREILKGEWDFDGVVVSDWNSIGELVNHGMAADRKEAAKFALTAGSDMDMEARSYTDFLIELVNEGVVKEELIDDAVRRILRLKFKLGLFDDPYRYCDEEREKELLNHPDHIAASLDVAKKSIVLLKNENNLLPLPLSGKKIALIGPYIKDKDACIGTWRASCGDNNAVSIFEGITNIEDQSNSFSYSLGCKVLLDSARNFFTNVYVNNTDRPDFKNAINIAKNADIVVLSIGEDSYMNGEARSVSEIKLQGFQEDLMKEIYKVNKNIVLLVSSGRPLNLSWADENLPTIVQTWQLGHQSGNAIAEVLFGKYNPSGKLPFGFPYHEGQIPTHYNHKNTGRPMPEGDVNSLFSSRYIDGYPNGPLYAFGHGLSYSSFEYSEVTFDGEALFKVGDEVSVSVDVTNTGVVDGEEVVQLYIRDLAASITRPVKELKGFEKVLIKKGETKTVTFKLTNEELGFYGVDEKFVVEPGMFDVWIGGSSITKNKSQFVLK